MCTSRYSPVIISPALWRQSVVILSKSFDDTIRSDRNKSPHCTSVLKNLWKFWRYSVVK
jgi:hypothetical protein